tara:strand:+ start:2491 stop:3177 length:687 start_codon:yes stop_codon:yes gene_type:complete
MFQLLDATPAKLATVTNRTEKHGDQDVPAVTLGIRITTANTLLDQLSQGLCAQLYKSPEEPEPQPEFDGMERIALPLRRDNVIDRLALKGELNGYTVIIDFGIDETSDIKLGGAKIDGFVVTPHEGGSIELGLRIGSSDLDELKAGRLAMLNKHEIQLKLLAPERKPDAIDGSLAAFHADHPGADGTTGGDDTGSLFDEDPASVAADRATRAFLDLPGARGDDDSAEG